MKSRIYKVPFYLIKSGYIDYYKKLYPFDKNEKRKIKGKVKDIEGMRQILWENQILI